MKVLGIGDNVVDKYMHTRTMYPGGNAFNIAVLSKMCGYESGYLGIFGDDDMAMHVYRTAKRLDIDLAHCRYVKGENGYAKVRITDGDREFIGSNKGGVSRTNPITLTQLDLDYIESYQLVHTSIFSYLEEELPQIAKTGVFLSMDFSDKASDAYYRRCAPYLDCACISCGGMELERIKVLMKKIMDYGCKKMVLATRGAKGAIVLDCFGEFYQQSPYLVEAKDTMGAGDSFIACFLSMYVNQIGTAKDFPPLIETEKKGILYTKEFQKKLIEISLYQAAIFSAKTCKCDGTFGFGKLFKN